MGLWHHIKKAFTEWDSEPPAACKAILTFCYFLITTIWIVPLIDSKFKESERRAVFFNTIIGELSTNTKDLLGDLAVLNKTNIPEGKKLDIYIEARKDITKLHWRSVEFAIIYKSTSLAPKIQTYQTSLSALEVAVDQENLNDKHIERKFVEDFAFASIDLLKSLAEDANITIKP